MPNPFADLDGKRKYLFTRGEENFYLKVVTSEEEAKNYRDAARALNSITVDSEAQLQETISKKGETLKNPRKPPSKELMDRETDNFYQWFSDSSKNPTMFVLENESGEFVTTVFVTINDRQKRQDVQVPESVGTFVYVSDISTNEKYRGQNLFSTGFDKALTMISNDKRSLPQPIEYSISMTATTAIKENGEEIEYVRNLPRYAEMWQKRFVDNKIQDRRYYVTDDGKTKQIGLERLPLESFLEEDRKVNEEEISKLIQANKTDGSGLKVRGLYLEGTSPSYTEIKESRKKIFEEKTKYGFARNKETAVGGSLLSHRSQSKSLKSLD